MERIGEILQRQFNQPWKKTEDLKTNQQFLWANDESLKEYEHAEPPAPLKCQFCGKTLYYKGLIHPFKSKTIWKWISPEECDCKENIKYVQEKNRKKQEEERKRQEAEEQRKRLLKTEKLFKMSKMGERFKTRTFDNFEINAKNQNAFEIAKTFAMNFEEIKEKGLGIMFNGSYGTGKTHLACSIAIELINRGIPVIYGTAITLLSKIRQTYSDNKYTNEWELLNTYCDVDLLIIDDLGKEKPSEWVLEKLYYIINQRYENLKPVIITTNYHREGLISRLSTTENSSTAEAIVSRLSEMCTGISMNFEDYRKL